MKDLKPIVAKNISELRFQHSMTQIELAEKLNYSDKAVSKWERAESLPDVGVLAEIAGLFGVTLDYLISPEHTEQISKTGCNSKESPKDQTKDLKKQSNHVIITLLSILLVWFVATIIFVIIDMIFPRTHLHWLCYAFAVPISMIIWIIFNSIWFSPRRNYYIVSLLMWSMLFALYITFLLIGINIWQIFIPGVPGQIIIIVWSVLRYKPQN